jgi:hypothetical protein
MIVVISISSVIIGVCSTTLHLLLRSEREQAREVRTTVAISRLSQVFREDVHAATECNIIGEEGKPRMELAAADGRRIVYSADEHLIHRAESRGGAEVHRDAFHFPPGTESRFERNGEPPVARLVLDLGAELPDSTPRALVRTARRRTVSIEAVPNRDQRFALIQP